MRTTVNLDDDVAAAVEQLRKERGMGVSSALNELARRGLAHGGIPKPRFAQQTSSGGARIDLIDVADALDLLDGPPSR
ncbi:ribbon-helix-helix CopG family protein [Pseudonocardia hierapolitana]|uniref:Ribbon-helix-helix CopG family protein n=1 Tax=Pseudonocardia hierapolitana TaxID=1128676 RepID=A0A561SJ67_9PSEU|nr:ribbon-helix-helix protein, CopG family [Pseudonocardia hierapolitana]TWF74873.1 ribbon-helix-helix CopG family protein [Pseudonocardia hierapolitana]